MLYFIVNKTSGTGTGAEVWKQVQEVLERRKIEYEAHETRYYGHAAELAEEISSKESEDICLVIVGGDGTINEVLNGITDFDRVRLGVIPNGSGNDFCHGLGLPRNPLKNLETILQAADKQDFRRIDLGIASGDSDLLPRKFGISAGVGLDAIVCKQALTSKLKTVLNKVRLGSLTYILLTVYTLFSMKTTRLSTQYRKIKEGKRMIRREEDDKLIFAAAMNMRAEGGGVPMAPKASCTDGLLSVCTAAGIPKWRTFFLLPFLVTAHHEHIKGFRVVDCRTVHLELAEPMVLHADGEYGGEVSEVTFTCLPGKLRFLQ